MASLMNKPGLCTKCNKPAEGRNYMVYECLKHLLCANCVKTRGGLKDTKCAFCRFKKGQKGGGHTLVGGNCSMEECFKDLTNCNFLCFECGIHQLCIPCAKQTESLDDEDCPLCFVQDGDDSSEPDMSHTTQGLDSSEPDMSHTTQGLVRTPLLLPKAPSSFTHNTSYPMDNAYWSLWRCPQPDTVILGGEVAPILTVLNARTGMTITHRIGNVVQDKAVISGLAIDTENHLIMLGNKDRWGQEAIYSLHLDQAITKSQTLYTNNQLTLGGSPRCIFHIKTFRFGVYHIDNPVRLEIFGLKDIIAETNPRPVKTTLLKKHTPLDVDKHTPLDADKHTPRDADKPTPRDADKPTPRDADKPTPRDADSLYVDEDDNILVSAFHDGCVYVYSREGVCVCKIGSKRKLGATSEAGMLFFPMSLQVYNNNCVVVTCRDGDVHVYYPENSEYTSGTWKLIQGEDKNVHRAIQTMGYHIVRDSDIFENIQVYRIGN